MQQTHLFSVSGRSSLWKIKAIGTAAYLDRKTKLIYFHYVSSDAKEIADRGTALPLCMHSIYFLFYRQHTGNCGQESEAVY